jgi:hypothetical protein
MPNDVALEVYYGGQWHDLVMNDQVLAEQQIVITRGDGAESAAPRPASLAARLNNDDDVFRVSNPESPLYGLVGRNTPVRCSVAGSVRAATEASSWRAGYDRSFKLDWRTTGRKTGKAWVDLESGGLLQRVNNWKEPLRSPFYTYNAALTTMLGYWSCEEERGSSRLTSLVPGTRLGTLGGAAFGSQHFPAGSAPLMDIPKGTTSSVRVHCAPASTTANSGWQLSFCGRWGQMPAAGNYYQMMNWYTTDGALWSIDFHDTNKVNIARNLGGSTFDVNFAAPSTDLQQWICFVVKVTESGGTVTVRVYWLGETDTAFTEIGSTTYSGITGAPRYLGLIAPPSTVTDTATVGHLVATLGTSEDLTASGRVDALRGHAGERATYRFARLCGLKNLPYFIRGDVNMSTTMGPQRVATLAEHFREIRDTDDGLIFDEVGGLYLIFTPLSYRYRQTATSIDVTELAFLPPETSDDLGVHNIVTVQNHDGGEAEAQDSTGPLGIQAPPDGVGEYEFTVNVNVDDETDLPQHANWWLRRGTVDLPRYPQVTINLAALDAARVAEIADIDIGDVIEITGFRENAIRLYVLGYVETIGWPSERRITFTCAPDQQFMVGEWDADESLWDLGTSTLAAQAGPTATTLTLAMTADEAWSSTSAYSLFIAGEEIGVPAGGMAARTGSPGAYSQVLTGAARSKNGVRKTLPAGSAVNVMNPGRWGR